MCVSAVYDDVCVSSMSRVCVCVHASLQKERERGREKERRSNNDSPFFSFSQLNRNLHITSLVLSFSPIRSFSVVSEEMRKAVEMYRANECKRRGARE